MRRLKQKLFKHIGYIPIKELKRKQIIDAIRYTEEERSKDLAHRLAQYCKQICSYAVHEELIDINPALELTGALQKYKKEHHAALEVHEIPRFLQVLERNDARLHLSRGRGAGGKVAVFGLLKRNGKVFTCIIPNAKTETLLPIIHEKVTPDSIVYTDHWPAYNALDVSD